jgi:hypothetical protein
MIWGNRNYSCGPIEAKFEDDRMVSSCGDFRDRLLQAPVAAPLSDHGLTPARRESDTRHFRQLVGVSVIHPLPK